MSSPLRRRHGRGFCRHGSREFSEWPLAGRGDDAQERLKIVHRKPCALLNSAVTTDPIRKVQCSILIIMNTGNQIRVLDDPFPAFTAQAIGNRLSGEVKVLG